MEKPTRVRVAVDRAGRIVLPKSLRQDLRLEAGDTVELERTGDQVSLRPVRDTAPLAKERGVWVFRTGKPLLASVTEETTQRIREERAGGG